MSNNTEEREIPEIVTEFLKIKESDVAESKRELFKQLNPAIVKLACDVFNIGESELAALREQQRAGVKEIYVPWEPKFDKPYLFVDGACKVIKGVNLNLVDSRRIEIGNCFRSEVEGEFMASVIESVFREYRELPFEAKQKKFLRDKAHGKIARLARESWGGESSEGKRGFIPLHNGDTVAALGTIFDFGLPKFKDELSLKSAFENGISPDECNMYFL